MNPVAPKKIPMTRKKYIMLLSRLQLMKKICRLVQF